MTVRRELLDWERQDLIEHVLKTEAEIERLRRINRELVRDHNRQVVEIANKHVTSEEAYAALSLVQGVLADAQRGLDTALGIVRREELP